MLSNISGVVNDIYHEINRVLRDTANASVTHVPTGTRALGTSGARHWSSSGSTLRAGGPGYSFGAALRGSPLNVYHATHNYLSPEQSCTNAAFRIFEASMVSSGSKAPSTPCWLRKCETRRRASACRRLHTMKHAICCTFDVTIQD